MILIFILAFGVICTPLFAQDFANLSLQEAFQIALEGNKNILSRRENINIKKGEFWSKISLPNPEISWEFEEIPKGEPFKNYGNQRFAITQEFEFPTNYFLKAKALNSGILVAEIETKAEENNLKNEVMKTYFEVVLSSELNKLARQNFVQTTKFYENVKKLEEFGETDKLSVLKAKVKKSIAQNELESSIQDSIFITKRFLNLLGISSEKINSLKLTDSLESSSNSYSNKVEGLATNPLLQLTKLEKGSAKIDKWLTYSEILPNFSFSYFQDKTENSEKFWGVELGISVPIWLIGYKGNIQQAKAKLRQAKFNKEFVELNLKNEFWEVESQLEKAKKQTELFKNEILLEAKEAFRVAEKSYQEGEIGFLDFFDSQQLLIEVQKEYLTAQFDYQVAKADLLTLIGFQQN
ncbi:MAG: TolC family protein [Calditrichaeota bacterium]|nr:MAG: TolC family protein [Calditrichota bacterium]